MIIKVPVYFEVDEKMTPQQAEEFLRIVRSEFSVFLKKTLATTYITQTFEGKNVKLTFVTESLVKKRLTGNQSMSSEPK